jgi:uncharacterized coiled-coil protein SlyX
MFRIRIYLLLGIFPLLGPSGIGAQQESSAVTLDDLYRMLQKQQKLIENQQATIDALSARLDDVAPEKPQTVDSDTSPPRGDLATPQEPTGSLDKEMAERRMSTKGMPANVLIAGEFPGSIRIPGSNMAAKVGGNVRLAVVSNFDPIGSDDRFIAGAIPVPGDLSSTDGELFDGATISAKRSLLNLDVRADSSVGQFRAFIEGDFVTDVGSSNVFRLRHAYGQYKRLLLGQTWSTLMDLEAEPEEIDFEGLNGEIVLRHPILRWSGGLGEKRLFSVAIEDPTPGIANGIGKSNTPDLVATINLQRDKGHVQFGGVLRDLNAEQTLDPDDPNTDETRSDSTVGWGLSFSGTQLTQKAEKNDKFMWQVNIGEGLGGYINDTATIGDLDAVFSPHGSLEAIPAFGGYLAYTHFWHRDPLSYFGAKGLLKDLRSTMVYGYTSVTNFDFQPDDAYAETQRASVNVVWSPITPIDVGVEYLWGLRKNKDGKKGTANQLQMVATFKF